MKEKQVKMGALYQATSGLLCHSFQGEIVAKLTNSAILQITKVSLQDEYRMVELNRRIVVRYSDLSPM